MSEIRSTAAVGSLPRQSAGLGSPRPIKDGDQRPDNYTRRQNQEPDQRRKKPDQILYKCFIGSQENEVSHLERKAAEHVDGDDHVGDDAVHDAGEQPTASYCRAKDHAENEDWDQPGLEDGEDVPGR